MKKFSKQHVLSDGLPIYRKLQGDDQDSVRLLTVEDLIVIAQQLTPAEVKEQLLKQTKYSIGDKSWRVRYMAATHFNEVCSLSLGESAATDLEFSARGSRWYRVGTGGVDRSICTVVER